MLSHNNETCHRQRIMYVLWVLQITLTLTVGPCSIFLQSKVEKLQSCVGIELTTLDLGSQSGAYDLSAI